MRIRLISDIHAEGGIDASLLENKGDDLLIIAGDLHVGPDNAWNLVKRFADHRENVIYIPGNHEFYRHGIRDFDKLKEWSKGTNIHFLNPGTVKIGDITFIGAPLWTDFQGDHHARLVVPRVISDFHRIESFTADTCVNLHTEQWKFIQEAYNKIDGKKIIISHFLPASECTAPEFLTENSTLTNKYFANNHGEWISYLENVPYWFFGHTHTPTNITIGDVNLIANPYGYGKNLCYNEVLIEI